MSRDIPAAAVDVKTHGSPPRLLSVAPPPLPSTRPPDLSVKASLLWSLSLSRGLSTDSMAPQRTRWPNLSVTLSELLVPESESFFSLGNPPDLPDVGEAMSHTVTTRFSSLLSPHLAHLRCPSDLLSLPSSSISASNFASLLIYSIFAYI